MIFNFIFNARKSMLISENVAMLDMLKKTPDEIDGFIAGKMHYAILRVQRMQSILLIFFDRSPINCCDADSDVFLLCTYLIKIYQ